MPSLELKAWCLVAAAAVSTWAAAQTVYKCGDSYGQQPCPGALIVDAADQRTRDQKKQADLATVRIARTADAMEKARIRQAQIDLAANTAPAPASAAVNPREDRAKPAKRKAKGSKYMAVHPLGEKKMKQPRKKRAPQKDAPLS